MGGGKRAHGRPGSNLGAALKSARDKKNAGHRKVHDKDHGEHLHVSEVHQVFFIIESASYAHSMQYTVWCILRAVLGGTVNLKNDFRKKRIKWI